jgi:hypothetical protein
MIIIIWSFCDGTGENLLIRPPHLPKTTMKYCTPSVRDDTDDDNPIYLCENFFLNPEVRGRMVENCLNNVAVYYMIS